MSHEISQLDIADRQLLSKPNVSVWTDIGEAEITHTIFGKAKVRIIHKHDKMRRTILLSVTGVALVIAMIWQGWVAFQQNESLQSAESSSPQRPSIEVIEPAALPVYTMHSPTSQPVKSKPRTAQPTDIGSLMNSQSSPMQAQIGFKPAEKLAEKPGTQQPLTAIRIQSAPIVTNTIAMKDQADKPLLRRPLPARQVAASAVAATTSVPIAASSPVAAPHVAQIIKESGLTPPPAGDKQLANPITVQGK